MVYQTEAPPVPTRNEEKIMIEAIKKSMQDQPYYKYYMNEGVRLAKMKHAEQLNSYRRDWWGNLARGCLLTGLIAAPILFKRAGRSSFGVPAYHLPGRYAVPYYNYFLAARDAAFHKRFLPVVLVGGYLYATWRTSMRFVTDEYKEKQTVVLPY